MTTTLRLSESRARAIVRRAADPTPLAPTSSLTERLAAAQVDLLAAIEGGLPEREWVPASEYMLARGKRHHISAKLKTGKSLALLVHAVDVVAAGATVVIVDRENGADEYARRLAAILETRPSIAREAVRRRLRYYAWPQLHLSDGEALARELAEADLVIFDSTRTNLSAFGLDEDRSDDYAKYAAAVIEPLMRAGIASVQLDNAGHGDQARARGTSSKGDLADIVYTLRMVSPFSEIQAGSVRLMRQHSRFGDVGAAFTLELGGGRFGSFTLDQQAKQSGTFRPTLLMERVSRALEGAPGLAKGAIREAVKGKNDAIDLALAVLVAEGHVREERDGRAHRHHVARPYREVDDPDLAPLAPTRPDLAPATSHATLPPCPTPKGGTGEGHDGVPRPGEVELARAGRDTSAAPPPPAGEAAA